MLLAFFVTVSLLWKYISAQEWNLSLSQAFQAAGDTARYGNPVEDTSEDVLVGLLVLSTFSAAVAGIIAGGSGTDKNHISLINSSRGGVHAGKYLVLLWAQLPFKVSVQCDTGVINRCLNSCSCMNGSSESIYW